MSVSSRHEKQALSKQTDLCESKPPGPGPGPQVGSSRVRQVEPRCTLSGVSLKEKGKGKQGAPLRVEPFLLK